jgi:hypothetical protein
VTEAAPHPKALRWRAMRWILTALVALALAWAGVGLTRTGCEALGFKWGPVPGRCVTPACALFHDCGRWAYPSARCGRVPPGAPAWRLFFELGEPETFDGGLATFEHRKASGKVLTAELRDGVVVRLDCAGLPPASSPSRPATL